MLIAPLRGPSLIEEEFKLYSGTEKDKFYLNVNNVGLDEAKVLIVDDNMFSNLALKSLL